MTPLTSEVLPIAEEPLDAETILDAEVQQDYIDDPTSLAPGVAVECPKKYKVCVTEAEQFFGFPDRNMA